MRRVKGVSIARYIITYLLILILALSLIMLLFVSVLANRVIYYDIQSMLIREIVQNNRNIAYIDGEFLPDESYVYTDDGMTFQLVDEDGEILIGKDPDGVSVNHEIRGQRLHTFESGGEEYYIINRVNRELTQAAGGIIYNRCIANRKDIDSRYRYMRLVIYGTVPVFILLVLLAGIMMSRRISKPLVEISKTAEAIGKEGEISRRMEYSGRITELNTLADTNNRMLDRLEDMLESQKRFSSDVAHELRTPIAVLMAQCEYAKEYTNTKEEFDEAIDVIYRQSQRASGVVSQILDLSRFESGRIVPELEDTDVDEIIRAICEDEELRRKDEVCFNLDLSGVRAQLDVGLMFILLNNLIQNAVKYSFSPAKVDISTKYRDNDIIIDVKDYGRGISEEELKKIFIPFYRVEESRNSEGSGLGLSLAGRIAQMHGGRIEVESEVNEGTTFTVIIPRR